MSATVPLPRYVTVACCSDTKHVSNRLDLEFLTEISGSEKTLTEAAAAGERTSEARILNITVGYRLFTSLYIFTTPNSTQESAGSS